MEDSSGPDSRLTYMDSDMNLSRLIKHAKKREGKRKRKQRRRMNRTGAQEYGAQRSSAHSWSSSLGLKFSSSDSESGSSSDASSSDDSAEYGGARISLMKPLRSGKSKVLSGTRSTHEEPPEPMPEGASLSQNWEALLRTRTDATGFAVSLDTGHSGENKIKHLELLRSKSDIESILVPHSEDFRRRSTTVSNSTALESKEDESNSGVTSGLESTTLWLSLHKNIDDGMSVLQESFDVSKRLIMNLFQGKHIPGFTKLRSDIIAMSVPLIERGKSGLRVKRTVLVLLPHAVVTMSAHHRERSMVDRYSQLEDASGTEWVQLLRAIESQWQPTHSSQELMSCILLEAVNKALLTGEWFADLLENLEDEVLHRRDMTIVKDVHYIQRGLRFVLRWIQPMEPILKIISKDMATDKKSKPLLVALESLKHATESIEMHMQAGSDLRQTWQEVQDKRLNTVNTLLAMVATVFLPLSFMTGVFGMNFEHKMWMLYNENGYFLFWGIAAVVAVFVLWGFAKLRMYELLQR